MENIMMLPASYCVMNEEEMTYTSGGANIVQAQLLFLSRSTDGSPVSPVCATTGSLIRRTGPVLARML